MGANRVDAVTDDEAAELYEAECRADRLRSDLEDSKHELAVAQESYTEVCAMQLAAIEDLNVQCKFWRQAAEHAVKGWNDLEDRVEAAREALVAIEHNADTALELLGMRDDCAPPAPRIDFAALTKDPASQGFPRLVEIETPIKQSEHDPDARDGRKEKP